MGNYYERTLFKPREARAPCEIRNVIRWKYNMSLLDIRLAFIYLNTT